MRSRMPPWPGSMVPESLTPAPRLMADSRRSPSLAAMLGSLSESEMQAELERLRAENTQLKSKDKGASLGHALQRTVAPHPGECAGDRGVHPRQRLQAEDEGVEL
jgi:hypothetical protein